MDAHPRTSSSDYVSQLDSRRRATALRPLGPLLAGACACETVDLRASRPARSAQPQAAADLCCPPPLPDSFEASRARAVFRLNSAPSSPLLARPRTHTLTFTMTTMLSPMPMDVAPNSHKRKTHPMPRSRSSVLAFKLREFLDTRPNARAADKPFVPATQMQARSIDSRRTSQTPRCCDDHCADTRPFL